MVPFHRLTSLTKPVSIFVTFLKLVLYADYLHFRHALACVYSPIERQHFPLTRKESSIGQSKMIKQRCLVRVHGHLTHWVAAVWNFIRIIVMILDRQKFTDNSLTGAFQRLLSLVINTIVGYQYYRWLPFYWFLNLRNCFEDHGSQARHILARF